MNIDWVIPCRFVEVHDNLATIIGAGIDHFWVPQEPRAIQLMLAVRLTGTPDELEAGGQHDIASSVRNPEGEVIGQMEGQMEVGAAGVAPAENRDWLQGVSMPIGVGFEANVEGTYTLTQTFDQSEASLPLHVSHSLPPGMQPPPGA